MRGIVMNYLWGGMLLIGILYGTVTGNLQAVTEAAVTSCEESVTLAVTMAGVTALWTGLMKIAGESGLITDLTRKMRPVLRFLFPRLPPEHPAYQQISMNLIANMLGLGWAATPAGLKAMEALAKLEEERKGVPQAIACNEMCDFLILNISSLQLIPVNVIAYRSRYGSANPAAVVGPAILATTISTAAAVLFCKLKNRQAGDAD